jgi:hypothetical protein
MNIDRREFLKLAGVGSAVIVLGPRGLLRAGGAGAAEESFFFVQVSDTHWGFADPKFNPDATGTLKKAIAAINALSPQPDFVVFTGDITHTTDDAAERRKRMEEARDIIKGLKAPGVRFLAGEHDAGQDNGAAFQACFGTTHYAFEHKGVHFIAIDNVSDPTSSITEPQLQWLGGELGKCGAEDRIVVLTHRPLFDLYPDWDWWTRDGAKALELLMPYKNVTVLFGHIHQEYHHMTQHIAHHAAKGMMYPLPAPGSVPRKAPVPWDPAEPYRGLGYRTVSASAGKAELALAEYPVPKG